VNSVGHRLWVQGMMRAKRPEDATFILEQTAGARRNRFLPIATEVSPFREKKKPFRRAQETGALNGDDVSAC
jgi:hypothetical protein